MSQPPHPASWQSPWPAPPPGPAPRAGSTSDRPLVLGLVALASLLVGAAAAGVVAMVLFVAGAEEIGRGLGEQMMAGELPVPGGESGNGPVEQFPAAEPGDLGDDAELDAFAADCFDGDLTACDTLYYEAPPMSDYEEYALTCGGRVKIWSVVSCTELD